MAPGRAQRRGTGARPAAVRAVFVVALAVLPLQHLVQDRVGEPYPGLYQPSFGGRLESGDVAVNTEPLITVTDVDGAEQVVALDDLLPTTRVLPSFVARAAFSGDDPADDAQTAAWLRGRLAGRVGADPARVTFEWREVERDLGSTAVRVRGTVETVVIDLAASS